MSVAWDSLTGAESPRWWARKALTGEGESTDARLDNGELDPLLGDADDDLQSRYPCVGSTPWSSLTGTQLSSWAKAVGFLAAMGEFQGHRERAGHQASLRSRSAP